MSLKIEFKNFKLIGFFGLSISFYACFAFLIYFETTHNDVFNRSIFLFITLIIANVAILISIIMVTVQCIVYLYKWPIRIHIGNNIIIFKYIFNKGSKKIQINEIDQLFLLKQNAYYPWYGYHISFKMNNGKIQMIYYLQDNLIRRLKSIINKEKIHDIDIVKFKELEYEAKGQNE